MEVEWLAAWSIAAASFIFLIGHVFGVCAQSQVINVDAAWNVAFVKYEQTGRNGTSCVHPRHTVSGLLLPPP